MSERGGVTVARCFLGGSSNVQFIVNTLSLEHILERMYKIRRKNGIEIEIEIGIGIE
jgi:GTP cyclohydrolase III